MSHWTFLSILAICAVILVVFPKSVELTKGRADQEQKIARIGLAATCMQQRGFGSVDTNLIRWCMEVNGVDK